MRAFTIAVLAMTTIQFLPAQDAPSGEYRIQPIPNPLLRLHSGVAGVGNFGQQDRGSGQRRQHREQQRLVLGETAR